MNGRGGHDGERIGHSTGLAGGLARSRLNRALLDLRGTILVDGQVEEDEKIVEILRRTYLLEVASNLHLVAVAGSQGVGKTTLIREIYGLDRDFLEGNLGRGERLPVVVRERKGVQRPDKWLVRVRRDPGSGPRDGVLERISATDAEWAAAVDDRDSSVLVAGFDAPDSFFGVDDAGFLLLPGYETIDPEDRQWQERVRTALIGSPACLVVTYRDLLAGNDQDAIVQDLRRNYRDSLRPVIAVSRTEGIEGTEARDELRRAASEAFEGVSQRDVVLTGTGDSYRARWFPQLRTMLGAGRGVDAPLRRQQLDGLKGIVSTDLALVINEADRRSKAIQVLEGDEKYRVWLTAFDDAAAKARARFAKSVRDGLGAQRHAARVKVEDEALTQDMLDSLDKVKDWILGRSDAHRIAWERSILDFWKQASAGQVWRAGSLAAVEGGLVRDAVDKSQASSEPDPSYAPQSEATLDSEESALPPEVARDLMFLAGASVEDPSRNIMLALRLLPAVGVEAMRFGVNLASAVPEVANDPHRAPAMEQTTRILKDIAQDRRMLLQGLVLFMGADIAVDGNIDSVPALAGVISTMLFGETAAAGSAAATVATTLASGVLVAAAAGAIINAANRDAVNDRMRAYAIIQGAYDATHEQLLGQFDDVMEMLRDRLDSRLRTYLRVDDEAARLLRQRRAIADCRSARADLLESIGAHIELGK